MEILNRHIELKQSSTFYLVEMLVGNTLGTGEHIHDTLKRVLNNLFLTASQDMTQYY